MIRTVIGAMVVFVGDYCDFSDGCDGVMGLNGCRDDGSGCDNRDGCKW